MSEMVERVAKILCAEGDGDVDPYWEDLLPSSRIAYLQLARATIKAMMEPTEEMLQAGRGATETPRIVLQAMLTAALED